MIPSIKKNLMPKNLKLTIVLIGILTLFFTLMRMIFFVSFEGEQEKLLTNDILNSLGLGIRFDIRIATIMIFPLFSLGGIPWLSPFFSKTNKVIWLVYLNLVFSFVSLLYIFDFGHYSYLKERINFNATRFLYNIDISIKMMYESYPVFYIFTGYIFLIFTFFYISNLFINRFSNIINKANFKKKIYVYICTLLFVVLAMWSNFSLYPLRWSDAVFSSSYITKWTYNPVHYFFDTWKNGGSVSCNKKKAQDYYDSIAEYFKITNYDKENLNYNRTINVEPKKEKVNIVLVLVESLASYKTSLSGNPLDPTPKIKSIANEGYYFKNHFTPSTGTARSVWTAITSIPDVEINGTSTRNPKVVNKRSIFQDFLGYNKLYFIGGSASWGNIRGVLKSNINTIYEGKHFNSPINDVWGISDIDLFREADSLLKKQEKPFIAMIQTAGNHRPYTIPNNSYGFKTLKEEELNFKLKENGFDSIKEYNAYRLMDYSISHFIDLAKKSSYAKNTIFVFWGDHGLPGNSGKFSPKSDESSQLNLGSHRVPLIIWSPHLIKTPKTITKVASEVDILATIAALSGNSYETQSFGRDLFDKRYDKQRYAFTIDISSTPSLGLISEKFFYKIKDNTDKGKLYEINSSQPKTDTSAKFPKIAHDMKHLTLGLYETAKCMIENKKISRLSSLSKKDSP